MKQKSKIEMMARHISIGWEEIWDKTKQKNHLTIDRVCETTKIFLQMTRGTKSLAIMVCMLLVSGPPWAVHFSQMFRANLAFSYNSVFTEVLNTSKSIRAWLVCRQNLPWQGFGKPKLDKKFTMGAKCERLASFSSKLNNSQNHGLPNLRRGIFWKPTNKTLNPTVYRVFDKIHLRWKP